MGVFYDGEQKLCQSVIMKEFSVLDIYFQKFEPTSKKKQIKYLSSWTYDSKKKLIKDLSSWTNVRLFRLTVAGEVFILMNTGSENQKSAYTF